MTHKPVKGGKMPWGKFKGCYIRFVEEDYIEWVKQNCDWDDSTRQRCIDELSRRKSKLFGI
jgi:hypothetical protein